MTSILAIDTPDGRRYAVHVADVADAARCSVPTVYRAVAAHLIGNPPQRGYLWADQAAAWVAARLERYGAELPVWVAVHLAPVP